MAIPTRRYIIKLDARNISEKKTHVFTDMFRSDDAKKYTINRSKSGLEVIGEIKLFNLMEFELNYTPILRKNVFISLMIHNLTTNKVEKLEDFQNISLRNTERYDAFLRKIRY